ncbi:hypothetical protein GT347_01335 [Xylophilus rhododendri]|uniref:Uncharacterized protein n=1 Tax=Xylophilus rhododendri TaxID=2697032 RepID=A0A857J0Y1_9BURK|nr:hypothetical protein [Xylophilus rhododendri]QHI96752.1 hypothetical protein GT347_01335 [Xylophilus rhododendri]
MAHFFRLIVGLMLALVGASSFASIPMETVYNAAEYGYSSVKGTPDATCADWIANVNARQYGESYWTKDGAATTTSCPYSKQYAPDPNYPAYHSFVYLYASSACPANSTSDGAGGCLCNAGYAEKGNACVVQPSVVSCQPPNVMVGDECMTPARAYCTENAGSTDVSREVVTATAVQPSSICVPTIYEGAYGCTATWERNFGAKGDDGKWYNRGTATLAKAVVMCNLIDGATGTDPTGTTPETAAPTGTKAECPNGQPGTVNGTTVCVPYPTKNGVVTDSGGTTTTTNPDGSKEEATKTNSVSCNSAGICSITTITTTVTTAVNGTTSTQQSTSAQQTTKAAYCATSMGKSDSACSGTVSPGGGSGYGDGPGDGTFSGSCSTDFQCSGDAIQCATARATWKTYCEASTLNDAAKAGIAAAMAKAGINQSSALDAGMVNLSPSGFDTSDALGGASCQIDKTVRVMGATVVLPLASVCPYLQYAGMAFVAVALLAGALIVFKT